MRKIYLLFLIALTSFAATAKESVTPTITPALFKPGDLITVTYDVTGTPLANLTNAYIWVWIPGENINAKYNINPATAAANTAKLTKEVAAGKTLFKITFKPSDFFDGSITAQTSIGMLLKGADWSNGQTTDFVTTFWDGGFTIKLNAPVQMPLFVTTNEQITISAETPVDATFKLYVNDVLKNEQSSTKTYAYIHTVTETSGSGTVRIEATSAANTSDTEFQYIISSPSPVAVRPAGIIPGINYSNSDPTKATVCLLAPGKSSVYVRGDFTTWKIDEDYLMKRDGEFFWLEIAGLTSGVEYGFQYLVDEEIFIADPYADKILDPDDQYIPESVYPSLKDYPQAALSDKWYFNRIAVLQTAQPEYTWQVNDFEKPAKESIVVYELLIRDFFGNDERTYANLADTIPYLKKLGINAIELMPIMEFNGNESWGYNPTFMFAPDKYYGPKNEFKRFVDRCHQEGIAVILDIAMNHQDIPNAYLLMDYDFDAGKPKITNKWFNPDAKHPFNVFFDMNHESTYTKAYLDTVNHYWLNEYKVDGFRFDLSKGFTQKNNPSNVDLWSAYDDTRVAILKRMADEIWEHTPDAIVILEHLSVNSEEKELAEYRAGEGKGMMLWGNHNHNYSQMTMGYASDSEITGINFKQRGWTVPHLVGYMESHDEERLMYKNKMFGGQLGAYSVKDESTGIDRIKAASVIFYTVPGPKMLWQFGELGYDYSINTCEDGSINNDCRVSKKPVTWDYYEDGERKGLFKITSDLIRLHTTYPVFKNGDASISSGPSLVRQVQVKSVPYTAEPSGSNQMNVQAVANLELNRQTVAINFPHTGIWYDYYNGGAAINVTTLPHTVQMDAGAYKLYTDVAIGSGPVTSNEMEETVSRVVYPNPTNGLFQISDEGYRQYKLTDLKGIIQPVKKSGSYFDISHLPAGMYIFITENRSGKRAHTKIIKQ